MAPFQRNGPGIMASPTELANSSITNGSMINESMNNGMTKTALREDEADLECLSEALDVPLELTNAELQQYFEGKMENIAKMQSHSKVAVLLISWEKEGDDYLDTEDEVNRLATVFEESYNFSVYKKHLHAYKGKSAKHQMNAHLAQFVLEEDGEDTLLIIYYAGHGVKDKETGLLRLVGGNPKKGNKSLRQIVWTEVERTIEETQADLFLIFDCCYAGQLAKPMRSAPTKIFDFLGSTQKNSTALSPGPESFTTALTWALTELARDHGVAGFTTSTLQHKISEAPNFPGDSQLPCLAERGIPSLRRLKIAPLPRVAPSKVASAREEQVQEQTTEQYFLNLQFMFSECPNTTIIDELTKQLRALVKDVDLPLQQVLWRGLFSEDTLRKDFSDVARRVLFQLRRKTIARKLKLRSISSLKDVDEGPTRKRQRVEE